jgi:hypothetical protein
MFCMQCTQYLGSIGSKKRGKQKERVKQAEANGCKYEDAKLVEKRDRREEEEGLVEKIEQWKRNHS